MNRRVEALDTTLGIILAASFAFGLYGMGQHPNWRTFHGWPFQTAAMVLVALGGFVSLYALVFVGDDDKDWLKLQTFDYVMRSDQDKALGAAIRGALASYELNRLSERRKLGFQRTAVWLLAFGCFIYIAVGYRVLVPASIAVVAAVSLRFFARFIRRG